MRPFPWKCEECGERAVYQEKQGSYTQTMDHDGRPYQVSVVDLDVVKCRKCGFVALESTALRRLSDALRSTVGLLQPSAIRAHRESLKLTQKELAGCLQIAEATLSRWETGSQIQQRSMDKFLRAFFALAELRDFLRNSESVTSAADTGFALKSANGRRFGFKMPDLGSDERGRGL